MSEAPGGYCPAADCPLCPRLAAFRQANRAAHPDWFNAPVPSFGSYLADPDDGLTLADCRVTNAVRCVPPANLPTPSEIGACNRFLAAEIAAMPRLRGVLALGGTAHNAVLRVHGMRPARTPFRHGAIHSLPEGRLLADSYHVSRLNTNTGRLTEAMFHAVVQELLDGLASGHG